MRIAPISLLLTAVLFAPAVLTAQKKTSGLVIRVDDVRPAAKAYNQFDSKRILEQVAYSTVLVSSEPEQQLVPALDNSFIGTIHSAYAQHHDLVLSPDDIWIQIALGVSIHVNEHYDELSAKIVTSPEKQQLNVRIDELADRGTPAWQRLIDTFALMAQTKTQPAFYKTMLPEFSTSTPETRTVLNAILLSSIRQSLDMRAASGCGIPNIVLKGTKADWEKLLVHVAELEQYDLKFWTDELKPILQEFVNAFDKKIDRNFWQRIYKYREGYMVMQMNGWASKFFPYFVEAEWVSDSARIAEYVAGHPQAEAAEGFTETIYYRNPYLKGETYLFSAIDLWNLPSSVCTVPFTYSNLLSTDPADHSQELFLYAGFQGIVQDPKTLALSCNPSWYVVRQNDYLDIEWENRAHSEIRSSDFTAGLWSEKPVDGPDVNAIYHPEKNANTADGIAELKEELRRHLKQEYLIDDLSGAKLQFTVTHFGSVAKVVFIKPGKLSEAAMIAMDLKLRKLNYTFKPTQVPFSVLPEEIYLDKLPGSKAPKEVPANSVVTLVF